MKVARVVGNVVSTIKDEKFKGYKLMIIEFVDLTGKPIESRQIAFDNTNSGPGDIVLVNTDGGAAQLLLDDDQVIADWVICGVLDHLAVAGQTICL